MQLPTQTVSLNKRLELLESGEKILVHISKFPIDPLSDKKIKKLIKSEIVTARAENRQPKLVENPRRFEKGMKRYKIYCNYSKEVLAYFYNTKAELDNYCDLHAISWHDSKRWYGCKGINQNQKTGEINFETCSGYATRKEPSLNNEYRYTDYIIKLDKNLDDYTK